MACWASRNSCPSSERTSPALSPVSRHRIRSHRRGRWIWRSYLRSGTLRACVAPRSVASRQVASPSHTVPFSVVITRVWRAILSRRQRHASGFRYVRYFAVVKTWFSILQPPPTSRKRGVPCLMWYNDKDTSHGRSYYFLLQVALLSGRFIFAKHMFTCTFAICFLWLDLWDDPLTSWLHWLK